MEILNTETLTRTSRKPPVIRISYGRIIFSVEAVKDLRLKQGDRISFITNEKDKNIVYFKKDVKGFPLMLDFKGITGIRLRICSRPLAQKILSFFTYNTSKTFSITNDLADVYGHKMWFILKDKIHKPIKWRKKETYKLNTSKT